jgi:hypothetical protein
VRASAARRPVPAPYEADTGNFNRELLHAWANDAWHDVDVAAWHDEFDRRLPKGQDPFAPDIDRPRHSHPGARVRRRQDRRLRRHDPAVVLHSVISSVLSAGHSAAHFYGARRVVSAVVTIV